LPSYEQSKSTGLWSVRFRVEERDGTVRNMRLSNFNGKKFKTKKEARYGYEDYITAEALNQNKTKKTAEDYYFEDFIKLFYNYKKSRIKESTFYDITKKITARILPHFSGQKMKDISPTDVLEWQDTLEAFSYGYKKTLHIVLGSIWTYAEKYYNLPNIMRKVDRPRNPEPKDEMQIYTPEEFEQFISRVDKPQFHYYFKFMYISGCRPEEACALKWSDINLSSGEVKITKSITYKAKDPGKTYKITTPKNKTSNRKIRIPHNFCQKLKKYKQWQSETIGNCDFIFSNGSDPLPPASITREKNRAASKAALHTIRTHDLRHSCASYLIHKGVSIVAISKLFGHASPQITWSTYAHLFLDDQIKLLEALAELP